MKGHFARVRFFPDQEGQSAKGRPFCLEVEMARVAALLDVRCSGKRIHQSFVLTAPPPNADHGANLCRYSPETMKALTMSALTKLPLNWFSFASQKL